jgi:hypothetical protein
MVSTLGLQRFGDEMAAGNDVGVLGLLLQRVFGGRRLGLGSYVSVHD